MPVKAVLFDLDGTIVDTSEDILHALNLLLDKYQQPPCTMTELEPLIPLGAAGIIKGLFDTNCDIPFQKLVQDLHIMRKDNLLLHTKAYPEMQETLTILKEKGIKLSVVSNNFNQIIKDVLKFVKLQDLFSIIIGQDDTGTTKPDPTGTLLACKMLNVKPNDCLFVGDSNADFGAAINTNMQFILAAYGAGKNFEPMYDNKFHTAYSVTNILDVI